MMKKHVKFEQEDAWRIMTMKELILSTIHSPILQISLSKKLIGINLKSISFGLNGNNDRSSRCSLKYVLLKISQMSQDKNLLQRRIWNPLEHLRWSFFAKQLTASSRQLFSQKSSIADVRLGSKYASEICFYIEVNFFHDLQS